MIGLGSNAVRSPPVIVWSSQKTRVGVMPPLGPASYTVKPNPFAGSLAAVDPPEVSPSFETK